MKLKTIIFCAIAIFVGTNASFAKGFPKLKQKGKIGIVSHRGYWDNDVAKGSENSIASLQLSDKYGFWGSEFDVKLTKDKVAIIWHDNTMRRFGGPNKRIEDMTYEEICKYPLPNGEKAPTIDEYLDAAKALKHTVLVCELKTQQTPKDEILVTDIVLDSFRAHKLLKEEKSNFHYF